MPGPNKFEKALAEAEAETSSIGTAAKGSPRRKKDASALLNDAFRRLRENPEIRKTAPDGKITYSDPVLAIASSWLTVAEDVGTAAVEGDDLTNATIYKWALVAVQAWMNRGDEGMSELAARVPKRPLKINKDVVRIAVVGDAGYRGVPQSRVIFMIQKAHKKKPFDLIVHLGDVYFSAGEAEMLRHLLVPFSKIDVPMVTLCGNHDLYHGPDAYLSAIQLLKQPGRFFLIKTPHWRIAALDTSFGSSSISRDDGKLDMAQLDWLKNELAEDTTKKGDLILMSHHFIISGWDSPAKSLSRQLAALARDQVFAWYWGHEHRCACYARGTWGFYGASVGNGAFLEKWSDATGKAMPAWSGAGARCTCPGIKKSKQYWPHGFLELELSKGMVRETYHLEGSANYARELQADG